MKGGELAGSEIDGEAFNDRCEIERKRAAKKDSFAFVVEFDVAPVGGRRGMCRDGFARHVVAMESEFSHARPLSGIESSAALFGYD